MDKRRKNNISDALAFEIKCRKILIDRLRTPHTALTRVVDKENTVRKERNAVLSEYESEQDAHEAYGYGNISWEEYEQIRRRFEDVQYAEENPTTPAAAALSILKDFIGHLWVEIHSFEWEALPDEDKQRIERKRAELKERVFNRRNGGVSGKDTIQIGKEGH